METRTTRRAVFDSALKATPFAGEMRALAADRALAWAARQATFPSMREFERQVRAEYTRIERGTETITS